MDNASDVENYVTVTIDAPDAFIWYFRIMHPILRTSVFVVNFVALACFAKFKGLRQQRFMLIFSLLMSNLVLGIVDSAQEIWHGYHLNTCLSVLTTYQMYLVGTVPYIISGLHLITIGVDRFLAVTFPFRYVIWVTTRAIKSAIAFVWIAPVVGALFRMLPILLDESASERCATPATYYFEQVTVSFTLFATNTVMLTALYGRLWFVARAQNRQIAAGDAKTPTTTTTPPSNKANRVVARVLLSFVLLMTPFQIFNILVMSQFNPNNAAMGILYYLAYQCSMATGFSNGLVYGVFTPEFQVALRSFCRCRSRRLQPTADCGDTSTGGEGTVVVTEI